MIKLSELLAEIKPTPYNRKLQPFKQKEQWFYFKDGDDYHNFYYGGYYYAPNDVFYTRYPENENGQVEKEAAMTFLKKLGIPFEYVHNEIRFDGQFVEFKGFTKTIDKDVLGEVKPVRKYTPSTPNGKYLYQLNLQKNDLVEWNGYVYIITNSPPNIEGTGYYRLAGKRFNENSANWIGGYMELIIDLLSPKFDKRLTSLKKYNPSSITNDNNGKPYQGSEKLSEIKPISTNEMFSFKHNSIFVIYNEEKWELFCKKINNYLINDDKMPVITDRKWKDLKYQPLIIYFKPDGINKVEYSDVNYFYIYNNEYKDRNFYKIYYLK